MENTIVKINLIEHKGYTPYCGNSKCSKMPRTKWDKNKEQFVCPICGWVSNLEPEFIKKYKKHWD